MTDQRQKITKIKWKRHEPSKNIRILFYKKNLSFAIACSKNSKLYDNRLEEQQNNMTKYISSPKKLEKFYPEFPDIVSFFTSSSL